MSSIFSRFDDSMIASGILRLIITPSYYKSFSKYLIKEYIYQGDKSPHARATRDIVSVLEAMTKGTDCSSLTILNVGIQINIRISNEEDRNNALNHYERWLSEGEIRERAKDDGVFDTFLNYLKVLQVAKLSTDMISDFNKFNIDSAIVKMSGTLNNINAISIGTDVEELDYDQVQVLAERQTTYASSRSLALGCDKIDDDLGLFRAQTLTVFLGLTGNGKTTMCHHLIRRCIDSNTKAMVFCVEDSKESFSSKVLASLTGIPKKTIEKGLCDPNQRIAIKKAEADLKKFIRVFFVYGKSISYIHERSVELEMLEKMDGKAGDYPVHIVDYTGHIYDKAGGKNDEDYTKIAKAYKERRDYAAKYNKICFDFMQVNREGAKKMHNMKEQVLSLSEIAKGFDLTHACDNIISINRDSKDIRDFTCKLHICKARDGVSGKTYKIATEFDKARYNMENATDTSDSPI